MSLGAVGFALSVRNSFGSLDDTLGPQIPGSKGPVTVLLEQLRDIEVDVEVLHSRVLADCAAQPRDRDAFWRGSPPTWADLHANLDVPRSNQQALYDKVVKLLEGGTHTLEVRHMPGAGGTTCALRLAWMLRMQFPTAVLRHYSPNTADKLNQLYQLAQRPILLVADASVLTPSAKEELFQALASRHTRVVLVYVVRTLTVRPGGIDIADPLSIEEARRFCAIYSARLKDATRARLLKENTEQPDREAYRTPFFYGLITYDREFQKIDTYVRAHLRDATPDVRKALRHLALVTLFSQATMDESLVRMLLGIAQGGGGDLQQLLGPAARLVTRTGRRLSLMHRLIAEEVLREATAGTREAWKAHLQEWSCELIRDCVRCCGPDSKEVRELFAQVFIRRDEWGMAASKNFAELIAAIETSAGRHAILEELTRQCPNEAHFWNHLGRHQIYEMRSDYEKAEEYLQRAVDLSPCDPLHPHALGMVRRLWLERQLENLFSLAPGQLPPTSEEVLAAIEPLASRAAEAFDIARRLRRDGEHGYVTHVQLIAEVAEKLMGTADLRQCRGLHEVTGAPAKWLRRNLVLANDLLETLRQAKPEADLGPNPNRRVLACESKLQALLGGLDELIAAWESVVTEGRADADLRRALMTAYHRKSTRVWGRLSPRELQRVQELAEANLTEDATSTKDVMMWLEASRRLPTFSFVRALDRLGVLTSHSEGIDASYYLFCLHFVMWQLGMTLDEEQIRVWLEDMRRRHAPRRDFSYEWFAAGPAWCPLVSHRDLDDWQPTSGLANPKLAFVTGTIDDIKGPQAGWIRLGRLTKAFFLPGTKFHSPRDLNKEVRCYVGFSYDGLRAWCVEPGPA